MKYVVADINGLQYKINEDQELKVNHLDSKEGDTIEFDKVLLTVDGDIVGIGKPFVKDAKVIAKVLKQTQGKKIFVAKFKAKTGYRRRTGFRSKQTLLKIEKINI